MTGSLRWSFLILVGPARRHRRAEFRASRPLYRSDHDRETAFEDPRVGCVLDTINSQKHTHHRLRGRKDLQPGKFEAGTPIYQTRTHLVLQADEPDGHRRRGQW